MNDGYEKFIEYFFKSRVRMLDKMCRSSVNQYELLIEFTRTTPVVITYGSAGLNGSVKMVGFIPKSEFLEEYAEKAYKYAYIDRLKDRSKIPCLLLEEFYNLDYIDLFKIGGLEMGFNHTWINIRENPVATLLFYTPPNTSFEVRCSVEIHDQPGDLYMKYLNAIHDIFHYSGVKSSYPAYVFKIIEVYDNSSERSGFGKKIYG